MTKSSNGKTAYRIGKVNKLKGAKDENEDEEQILYFDADVNLALPYNLIQLVGTINIPMAAAVSEMLLTYDYRNLVAGLNQPIHMIINSPGGEVASAWQICDVMDSIKTPVYTIGTGMIASSALLVFINGEEGHRVLSKRSSVMSHQYSWGVEGRHSELISAKDEFKNIYKRMVDHYHINTGLTREEIKDELLNAADRWLTASQAKKLRLADRVSDFKIKNPLTLIEDFQPEVQRQRLIDSVMDTLTSDDEVEIEFEDEEEED